MQLCRDILLVSFICAIPRLDANSMEEVPARKIQNSKCRSGGLVVMSKGTPNKILPFNISFSTKTPMCSPLFRLNPSVPVLPARLANLSILLGRAKTSFLLFDISSLQSSSWNKVSGRAENFFLDDLQPSRLVTSLARFWRERFKNEVL